MEFRPESRPESAPELAPANREGLPASRLGTHQLTTSAPGEGLRMPKLVEIGSAEGSKPLTGRVSDPRKTLLLSGTLQGKIYRLVLRILGQGDKITQARAEAKNLDREDREKLVEHITTNIDRLQNAPKIADYRGLSDGVSTARLPQQRPLDDWKEAFEKKPIMDKAVGAQVHVTSVLRRLEEDRPAAALQALDGKEWTGLRISPNDKRMIVVEGHISATSERNTGAYNHADLHNIYVHVSNEGHITITTAVIDTPVRAEEFMQAVVYAMKKWQDENPGKSLPPLRLCMHQLNTHGVIGPLRLGEVNLIEGQHRMATYMNARLPTVFRDAELWLADSAPYVIHKNHALNTAAALPGEATFARQNNLDGTAGQMVWLGETLGANIDDAGYKKIIGQIQETQKRLGALELQALPQDDADALGSWEALSQSAQDRLHRLKDMRQDLSDEITDLESIRGQHETVRGLEESFQTLSSTIQELEEPARKTQSKPAMRQVRQEIKAAQALLKQQLKELSKIQEMLLSNQEILSQSEREAITLGNIVLADQLNLHKDRLTQMQRIALDFLMDEQLGITTQTNCKSSCDRTAVARALTECLAGLRSTTHPELPATPQEKREFIMNFEEGVRRMDAAFRGSGYKTMNEFLHSIHSSPEFRAIYGFQTAMFAQLMAVGMPITGRSTGLEGYKWHHDLNSANKNYHPLPYIPAEIFDEKTGEFVKVLTADSRGKRNMTYEGICVFMGNAQGRGN